MEDKYVNVDVKQKKKKKTLPHHSFNLEHVSSGCLPSWQLKLSNLHANLADQIVELFLFSVIVYYIRS